MVRQHAAPVQPVPLFAAGNCQPSRSSRVVDPHCLEWYFESDVNASFEYGDRPSRGAVVEVNAVDYFAHNYFRCWRGGSER
jgi:hypothetical protein